MGATKDAESRRVAASGLRSATRNQASRKNPCRSDGCGTSCRGVARVSGAFVGEGGSIEAGCSLPATGGTSGWGRELTPLTPIAPVGGRQHPFDRLRDTFAGLDWTLLIVALGISAFGIFVVRAATVGDIEGSPNFFFARQAIYVGAGAVLMVAAMTVDIHRVAGAHWLLFGGLCAAVAVVLAIGAKVRGSSRWIDFGVFKLQPSEIGKVAIIVILASIAVERTSTLGTWRFTLTLIGVTTVPALIVFLQPDLGTTLVYFAILATILLVTGIPLAHLATLGASIVASIMAVLVVLPAFGVSLLKDYQLERLTAFTNSSDTASLAGYQLEQSKIAIGSGGAFGKGVDGATQTRYDFLPEHHTDFIFAVVCEMFGFVGGALLVLGFGVLLWRALRIVARAPSAVEQLIAAGILGMFVFQLFVNIGMTMGIMPITGIPLPLMSFGGSHTLTNLIAVGLLLQIGRRPRIGALIT